jgi:hypothetical protein
MFENLCVALRLGFDSATSRAVERSYSFCCVQYICADRTAEVSRLFEIENDACRVMHGVITNIELEIISKN